MPMICPNCSKDMPKICPRYAHDMPKICPWYAQDIWYSCESGGSFGSGWADRPSGSGRSGGTGGFGGFSEPGSKITPEACQQFWMGSKKRAPPASQSNPLIGQQLAVTKHFKFVADSVVKLWGFNNLLPWLSYIDISTSNNIYQFWLAYSTARVG